MTSPIRLLWIVVRACSAVPSERVEREQVAGDVAVIGPGQHAVRRARKDRCPKVGDRKHGRRPLRSEEGVIGRSLASARRRSRGRRLSQGHRRCMGGRAPGNIEGNQPDQRHSQQGEPVRRRRRAVSPVADPARERDGGERQRESRPAHLPKADNESCSQECHQYPTSRVAMRRRRNPSTISARMGVT